MTHFFFYFFRGCKYSLSKAKRKFGAFLGAKASNPEYFADFRPGADATNSILDQGLFLPLPAYDLEGRRIILERSCSVQITDIDEYVKAAHWIFLLLFYTDEQAQVSDEFCDGLALDGNGKFEVIKLLTYNSSACSCMHKLDASAHVYRGR